MIQLYAKGTTDFSRGGISLHPQESTITFQENGQFDLELIVPAGKEYTSFDYGQILKATVPTQVTGDITLGTVSYFQVSNSGGATLYSQIPKTETVSYQQWSYNKALSPGYAVGNKVTYYNKNYRCTQWDATSPQVEVPPNNSSWWTEISRTKSDPGKVAAALGQGDVVLKTADFNDTYMEAADLSGNVGYIAIEDCQDMGETETRVIPSRTITEQLFVVMDVQKEQNGQAIRVTAEHISYQLGRTTVGDCNLVNATPATALLFLTGAMKESYPGELYTNITAPDVKVDWSWTNAQAAILDPKSGLAVLTNGVIIRDNFDLFLLANTQTTARYSVRYGANMKNVKWTGSVDNIVTRVYPTAQTEDGSTLLLPEECINSVRAIPFVRPEVLRTGLKVGETVKEADGTETELTEEAVLAQMRTLAWNRFTVDKCDMAEVNLDLDWVHMPDTEEYEQYQALRNAAPGDLVQVVNGPLGINEEIRLTGYTWDPIGCVYKKTTFGTIRTRATVGGYALKNGCVTGAAIAGNTITGDHIMADTITAREIMAESITADKIAARVITTELLMAGAVTANEIAAGTITADQIAAGGIKAGNIEAQAIQTVHLAALAITTDKLAAAAVTADKIGAGEITTATLAAQAVTADKIASGAITTDKLAAASITAGKIDTNDLTAINATLGTADIADARISVADIAFGQVKDLNAQSAYFGQAVIQEGLANKLYIPRLAANYAQIVNATISDLVIQASNDNFYKLDVDLGGNVTATEIHPTSQEIEDGHTTDGRTIYLGTDIVAADLNTMNIYASHALMDELTANLINVDKLFAREATIAVINATDLSSNTYIRSTVGDWVSGSTITQTINAINTRITSLGYGTFYYSETEPSHSGLVAGDVWIQPDDANSWNDVSAYSWQDLSTMTWDEVLGKYKMYVWTGNRWKLLYDSQISASLQTQITQNAYAITLKADETEVSQLSGQVTEFAGELEVQSRAITAAVSTVNMKGTNFVQATDPTAEYEVHTGDYWTKTLGGGTWNDVRNYTWNQLKDYTWGDLGGTKTYVWTGSMWLLTGDSMAQNVTKSELEILDSQVKILSETSKVIGYNTDRNAYDIETNRAQITVQADRITQEVERATTAEARKISKTTQYQTADAIVSEAVSQSGTSAAGLYLAKTTVYQTADAIVTEAVSQSSTMAAGAYIAKTTVMQTADAIVSEAVRQSASAASGAYIAKTTVYQSADDIKTEAVRTAGANADLAYIAKTSTYQSADEIISEAVRQSGINAVNACIAKTTVYQSATDIVATAESYTEDFVNNTAYKLVSGITITSVGIDISGSQYVKIASGGYFQVQTGDFGIDTNVGENGYCLWAGAQAASNAYFRVKKNGAVTLTKLLALDANGNETEVNLRTAGLWKLNYHTVKSYTDGSITLSNNDVINFISASSLAVGTDGAGYVYATSSGSQVSGTAKAVTASVDTNTAKSYSGGYVNFGVNVYFSAAGGATIKSSIPCVIQDGYGSGLAYDAGRIAGRNSVTISDISVYGSPAASATSISVKATASNGESDIGSINITTQRTDAYNTGWKAYYDSGYWQAPSASNNWTCKVPNRVANGSEDYTAVNTALGQRYSDGISYADSLYNKWNSGVSSTLYYFDTSSLSYKVAAGSGKYWYYKG